MEQSYSVSKPLVKRRSLIESEQHHLRERFMHSTSFEAYSDKEILETVLSYANRKEDKSELADRLLESFGSLKGVLEARPEQLQRIEGMNTIQTGLISMMVPMARVWMRCANEGQELIRNSQEAEAYCKGLLIGERVESAYVIAMNAQLGVVGKRQVSIGSISEVSVYPRIVVETALNFNARTILLCHNHPGGTCKPSREDILSTHSLQKLLPQIGIYLLGSVSKIKRNAYSMQA